MRWLGLRSWDPNLTCWGGGRPWPRGRGRWGGGGGRWRRGRGRCSRRSRRAASRRRSPPAGRRSRRRAATSPRPQLQPSKSVDSSNQTNQEASYIPSDRDAYPIAWSAVRRRPRRRRSSKNRHDHPWTANRINPNKQRISNQLARPRIEGGRGKSMPFPTRGGIGDFGNFPQMRFLGVLAGLHSTTDEQLNSLPGSQLDVAAHPDRWALGRCTAWKVATSDARGHVSLACMTQR